MAIQSRTEPNGAPRSVSRRGRRHLASPAAFLTLTLSGCLSERAMMWPVSEGPTPVRMTPQVEGAKAPAAVAVADSGGSEKAPTPPRSTIPLPRPIDRPAPGEKVDRTVTRAATSTDPNIPLVAAPPVVPPAPTEYPIDLTTALRLAEVENPEIAEARQRIFEALAGLQAARALLLPTLNAGTMYHGHTGNLQRSSGRILSLSEQSLYVGGGTRTVAAESLAIPAVNIVSPLTDALFNPLVEAQRVDGVRLGASGTVNAILLDVASLHFDLVAAEVGLELRRETEAEAAEVARITASYARAGQGRPADANRAATERNFLHREVQKGEEDVAVASVRLARRLHLDQVVRLRTVSPQIAPITLVDIDTPTEGLVRAALQLRPEVGASAAAIGVAETRLMQERARPLLPTVWVGFSGGGFGGGSNLVPPLLGNFKGRTDLDVRLYWTLQNLGMGNFALMKTRQGEIGQAVGVQSRVINQVRREVTAAQARAKEYRQRIENTYRELVTAQDGFRQELDRIRNTVGRPVEVINSLRLLGDARLNHLRAIVEYDRAQFQLFVALGSPPPLAPGAEHIPLPPAPVAPPPTPPPSASNAPRPEQPNPTRLADRGAGR
jgi:outer membrane protein TolC